MAPSMFRNIRLVNLRKSYINRSLHHRLQQKNRRNLLQVEDLRLQDQMRRPRLCGHMTCGDMEEEKPCLLGVVDIEVPVIAWMAKWLCSKFAACELESGPCFSMLSPLFPSSPAVFPCAFPLFLRWSPVSTGVLPMFPIVSPVVSRVFLRVFP